MDDARRDAREEPHGEDIVLNKPMYLRRCLVMRHFPR
jgi:hypothetical protein